MACATDLIFPFFKRVIRIHSGVDHLDAAITKSRPTVSNWRLQDTPSFDLSRSFDSAPVCHAGNPDRNDFGSGRYAL